MKAKTFVKSLALAAALVPALAAMASASPAKPTGWLNVRSGPSTHYSILGTVGPHQVLHVSHCRQSWCAITYHGHHAWVSKHYLNFGYQQTWQPAWQPQPWHQPTYHRPNWW